jgi:hypothetical protein
MTVFTDLAASLGVYVGGSDVAGAILGLTTITIFLAGFTIMFGRDFIKSQTGFILMLTVIGFVSIPNVVGWFPIWIPFLMVLVLALSYWQKWL